MQITAPIVNVSRALIHANEVKVSFRFELPQS